jgi:hypothetical protein
MRACSTSERRRRRADPDGDVTGTQDGQRYSTSGAEVQVGDERVERRLAAARLITASLACGPR